MSSVSTTTTPKFLVGQTVNTFDRNFEPQVPYGTLGVISEVLFARDNRTLYGYDVEVQGVTDGPLFFLEKELTLAD